MKRIELVGTLFLTAVVMPHAAGPVPLRQDLKVRPISQFEIEKLPHATILWNPDFADDMRTRYRIRAALMFDLDIIDWQVPAETWRRLGEIRIVISPKTEGWAADRLPSKGRGSGFHHTANWLRTNGFDAEREGVVEIYNATDFLTNKPVFPMVLVHELTHRLQYLAEGADSAIVTKMIEVHKRAIDSGKGAQVAHILAPPGELKAAPWMKAPWREYIAERAEAFFGRDQYYPFTRDDLISYDREACDVVADLWATKCAPRLLGDKRQ
jgi:hypothetical protein